MLLRQCADLCLVIIPPLAVIVLLLIPLGCWVFLPLAGVGAGVACGFVEVVYSHSAISCYVAWLTTSVASCVGTPFPLPVGLPFPLPMYPPLLSAPLNGIPCPIFPLPLLYP